MQEGGIGVSSRQREAEGRSGRASSLDSSQKQRKSITLFEMQYEQGNHQLEAFQLK
jgi:hypothetical protein